MHSCPAGSPPGDLLFFCFRGFCVLHRDLPVSPYLVWFAWAKLSCVGWIWQKSLRMEAQGLYAAFPGYHRSGMGSWHKDNPQGDGLGRG